MKLIESNVEYIPQAEGLEGIYRQIEIAGRTAYKSENKITEGSAKKFVDMLIRNKHNAALEHGTVYLAMPITTHYSGDANIYMDSPYCRVNVSQGLVFNDKYGDDVDCWCITTNLRFIQENDLWQDVEELCCVHTPFHEKRYTMRFTCSRAIAQELTRHRVFSFLMESQRYCNYSKDKFGGEITFIIPHYLSELKAGRYINHEGDWYSDLEYADPTDIIMKDSDTHNKWNSMLHCFEMAEQEYQYLLKTGATPQQARDVLPNATKTELIMTGFSSDWRNLLDIRYFEKTGKVHPDMKVLMQKLTSTMSNVGVLKDIMKYPSKFD